MNRKITPKTIRLHTVFAFLITFAVVMICAVILNQNQVKEEQMKAAFTAESTVNRIESQMNQYLVASDFMKNVVESGYVVTDNQFAQMATLLQDEEHVIEAFELAKDGLVSQVYPLEGNEEAIGLDMLTQPERRKEAQLAKESGQYTIAGPFELVQGGTGALLFDPIYMEDASGEETFWGFSLLVLNWDKFVDRLGLDSLENANYHYRIWKHNMSTDQDVSIAQCDDLDLTSVLEVACKVPNDTWYFEIAARNGWLYANTVLADFVIALAIAFLAGIGFWQFEQQRYKDRVYAREIEKSAAKARLANEAKTRFLFNMSHDIRTPMNAIIGFSELLEEHITEREKVVDYIQKIKSSSEFLLSLINDILEMARIESGKASLNPAPVNSRKLLESLEAVFEPTMRKKDLQYTCRLNINHDYVICDETKVREILLNVLGNSVKYTPDGGQISLIVTEIPSPKADCVSTRVIVEDTGIGMSEKYLPHIFEEFTRERTSTESKVVGTGLGLPIVKALVELMEGTIQVESELGKGTRTTIELTFPTASKEQIDSLHIQLPSDEKSDFAGRRILLAEDNDLNAEIAMTILEENGFLAERAEDGQICVEMVKNAKDRYYSLILMDIQMPNMNGYDAAREIRRLDGEKARIPIIAMTANAFEEDKKKALAAGMNAHIAKPFDLQVLLKTMEQVLSK